MELTPGTVVLDGRFKIVRLLGTGGMGVVYLAEQVSLGRSVAVKVLHQDMATQSGMGDRFQREARLLSAVDHPSVVRVIDFGQSNGAACLVMEYVEGKALDLELKNGPLMPDRAIRVLVDLAEGLAAIHDKGIIHRDLNPKNVVLTRTPAGEKARLLDFGIARLVETQGQPVLSQIGIVIGTPEYLSPEQSRGAELSTKSDLYMFGLLAYELLSGELPFKGPTAMDYLKQHANHAPIPLADSAPHLVEQTRLLEIVMRCLAKNPSERPLNARELAEKLRALPEVGEPTVFSESVIQQGPILLENFAPMPDMVRTGIVGPAAESSNVPVHPFLQQPPSKETPAMSPPRKSPWNRALAALPQLPRPYLMGGAAALAVIVLVLAFVLLSSSESQTLAEIRATLERKQGKEAFAAIEAALPKLSPLEKQRAELYRAVALHQMNRHPEELRIVSGLDKSDSILENPLVLGAILEDFGRTREDPQWKAVLTRLPQSSLEDLLEDYLDQEPPLRHWGSLRYLDISKSMAKEDLVKHYLKTLEGKACGMKAVAARRLGELGDPSAEEPLKKLRATPKEGNGVSERGCGQDEAAAALASLKKSAAKAP